MRVGASAADGVNSTLRSPWAREVRAPGHRTARKVTRDALRFMPFLWYSRPYRADLADTPIQDNSVQDAESDPRHLMSHRGKHAARHRASSVWAACRFEVIDRQPEEEQLSIVTLDRHLGDFLEQSLDHFPGPLRMAVAIDVDPGKTQLDQAID